MSSVRYSRQILLNVEFSPNIIKEFSNIKVTKISPVEAELTDGEADRHDEANSRFS